MKLLKSQYPKLIILMQRAYPDYKGRKFFLEITDEEFDCISYWDEGSRTYYKFVTPDGNMMQLPNTHPYYQHTTENRTAKLTTGLACIKHSIFCGHDCGLTLMLCSADAPKLIEKKGN